MIQTFATSRTRRIVFIGDDPQARELVEQAAAATGDSWKVEHALTAADALELLDRAPTDVVVASMKGPQAIELLDTIMVRHPETSRILLSDAGSAESMLASVGKVHHFVQETCGWPTLLELLERIDAAVWSVYAPGLPALIPKLSKLPSPPEIYLQIVGELQTGEPSVARIGSLIAQDPPLTAKILQLANSAVFGLQLQVTHPAEAVNYLGFETTKALLLLAHTFSFFEQLQAPIFDLHSLQYHALAVARYAQRIAEMESDDRELHDQAFTGGLLHDIGKLLLGANIPHEYGWALKQSQEQNREPAQVEAELLGASHAEVGGYVLDTWHLPKPVVEAVAWHHRPSQAQGAFKSFSALSAVHVANAAEHEFRPDPAHPGRASVDLEYLNGLGCADRLVAWYKACQNSV